MTYFRICSTCLSRSQAPLCHYTRRLVSNQAEGTFARLRYALGGDRPSQTAHLALSAARVHGTGLEFKHNKGGVSFVGSAAAGTAASEPPTYTTHAGPKPNTKLQ